MDYNADFQRAHRGSFARGHWHEFLSSLGGAQVPPCDHCVQLCREFSLSCAAHAPSQPEVAELVVSSDEEEKRPVARRLFDSDVQRGRPRQDEERESLSEFISRHRPGKYKILSSKGKVPVKCLSCGCTFNAYRLSSPWFVNRHERESVSHLRWARGLVSATEPAETQFCTGIRIMDPFSGLQELEDSVVKHMQNRQMSAIGSVLQTLRFFQDDQGQSRLQTTECHSRPKPIRQGRNSCKCCEERSKSRSVKYELASWAWKTEAQQMFQFHVLPEF